MKTFANYQKIWANSLKIRAKWRPTYFDLTKMGPKVCRITWRSFLEVIRKTVMMRNYSYKKWPQNFSGTFGKIRAKILCTSKNLLAATSMSGNTYFDWCSAAHAIYKPIIEILHVFSFFKRFQKHAASCLKTGNLCNFRQFDWNAFILSNVKSGHLTGPQLGFNIWWGTIHF